MRLRNIPRAEETIRHHSAVIKEPKEQRGRWNLVFANDHPIHIEIGMGKGKFLLCMAEKYPEINFVGIERYSSVLLRAVELYDTERFSGSENVRFICMDAREIQEVFAEQEVGKIYLNFSDPWPKARHAARRLTSAQFLDCYGKILSNGGEIEFKTDNTELFDFSMEQAKGAGWRIAAFTYDLHHNEAMGRDNIMTEYEEKFSAQGKPVHKMIIRKE